MLSKETVDTRNNFANSRECNAQCLLRVNTAEIQIAVLLFGAVAKGLAFVSIYSREASGQRVVFLAFSSRNVSQTSLQLLKTKSNMADRLPVKKRRKMYEI